MILKIELNFYSTASKKFITEIRKDIKKDYYFDYYGFKFAIELFSKVRHWMWKLKEHFIYDLAFIHDIIYIFILGLTNKI